jgi:hypothetical protein
MPTQNNILIVEEDLNVLGVLSFLEALLAQVQSSGDEKASPWHYFPSIYVSGNFAYVQMRVLYAAHSPKSDPSLSSSGVVMRPSVNVESFASIYSSTKTL